MLKGVPGEGHGLYFYFPFPVRRRERTGGKKIEIQ
jgi:hypothetical protein